MNAFDGVADPRRLDGLDELVRRQFNEWFEWLGRINAVGFGLFEPVFLTGASNDILGKHVNKYLLVSHTAATSLKLNASILSSLRPGSAIYMCQLGTGQLSLAPSGGVTVNTAETLKTRKQFSSMMLIKTRNLEAIVNGDLELA